MICLVAVSYYGANDAWGLATSLLAQDFREWRLCIVDNAGDGAEEGTLASLQERDQRISVVHPGRNLGYFGAARFAIASLPASSFDIVAVCNVDLKFRSTDGLRELLRSAHAGAGVLAPAILSSSTHRDQNPCLARPPGLLRRWSRRLATCTPFFAQVTLLLFRARYAVKRALKSQVTSSLPSRAARDIYAPHGAMIAFTREYFEGGGDLAYPGFLFGEEVFVAESCLRLGLSVTYCPAVELEHIEHGQIGWIRSRGVLREMARATQYIFTATRGSREAFDNRLSRDPVERGLPG